MAGDAKLQALPEDWERALAIVAHPDDLEYGAASAVARWTAQGKSVAYLLVTRGEAGIASMLPAQAGPLREEEERRSAAVVGATSVDFLGYPDGMIEYGLELRRDLAQAIRQHQPEILITLNHHPTWGEGTLNMADHRWVGLATMDAARDAGNGWVFPELRVEDLPPWGGVRMICVAGSPTPTHGVDVSDFLDRGIASLREHRVYLDNLTGDFDAAAFLGQSAATAGAALGCQYAVSFEVFWF